METARRKHKPGTKASANAAAKRKPVSSDISLTSKKPKCEPVLSENAGSKRKPTSKSTTAPKAQLRSDPSVLVPLAGSARMLLRRAHALVSVLQGEMWLLSQIHYRDHYSMRTSKFYQSGEGLLRAVRRLLGDVHPSPAYVKRTRRESRCLPVSSRTKCKAKARFPPVAPEMMSEPPPCPPLGSCALRDALRHGTRVVVAMYPPGKRRGNNPLVPPKMSGVPNARPPIQVTRSACRSILQAGVQLVALLDQCQSTYRTLTLHIRTGPAPTFVPSVISMLAIAARIHMAAREILFGKAQPLPVIGATADQGLLELYALLAPLAGDTGERLDLFALVCALKGKPTLPTVAVDRIRPLLHNGEGELPSSLELKSHALSVGGVPWLNDLRILTDHTPVSLPSDMPSKAGDLPPAPAPSRLADSMLLDDDLGEVVEG